MTDENYHNHDDNAWCDPNVTGVSQALDVMDSELRIWHAALNNDMARLTKLLLKRVLSDVDESSGYIAVHNAARAGHYDICKHLLDMGANPNVPTRNGRATPLYRAVMFHHPNIIQLLLDSGANINIQDVDGNIVLYLAIKNSEQIHIFS